MSEPNWTPGPWEYHDSTGIITGDDGSTLICDGLKSSLPEVRANAHLIASAPAMYDALALVADRLDYLENLWGSEGVTRTIADRVKAAIAQARGED